MSLTSRYIPEYNTPLFTDIYNDVNGFIYDFQNNGIPAKLTDESASLLFYLLYARYGNSPIANWDTNQFKYKLFSVIFQYGPAWEKRLEIQDKMVKLKEEDIVSGGKQIHNHAYNPGQAPSTASLEELTHINEQQTAINKRSVVDAYRNLWNMIKVDVTEEFLDRFQHLFKTFVLPENPILFITEEEN